MNVIFDIADVLLDWDIDIMLEHISDPEDRNSAVKGIIEHEDWLELDRGRMELDTAIDRASERTGLPTDVVSRVMEAIPRSLVPNKEAIALLDEIDRTKHRVFCLSNLHKETWEGVFELNDFWSKFENILISWQVGYIKPEIEMYQEMLKRFEIKPDDCLFIDDRPGNIAGAKEAGIRTILYKAPEDCRKELQKALKEYSCLT